MNRVAARRAIFNREPTAHKRDRRNISAVAPYNGRVGIGRPADKRDKPARFPTQTFRAPRGRAMNFRKDIGPCDPRPLAALAHANNMPGPDDRHYSRPGYSLAEALALFGGPLARLQKSFAMWGTHNEESLYRPIGRDHWLETDDANASKLVDKSIGGFWLDVRFIPEMFAPNIHEFVDGLPLRRAFERLVLGDPECRLLFDAARKVAPSIVYFIAESRLFGPDQLLRLKEPSFLSRVCSRYLNEACGERAGKRVKLGAYPDVIGRKSQIVLGLLSTARLLSDGFYRQDLNKRIAIDQELWMRPEYAIDLRGGDLINIENGEAEWRSIVLHAPNFVELPSAETHSATAQEGAYERTNSENDGLVRLGEAATELGIKPDTLRKRADRDSVKKRTGNGTYVPRCWVSQQKNKDQS